MYDLVERYLSRVWLGGLNRPPTGESIAGVAAAIGQPGYIATPAHEVVPGGVAERIGLRSPDGAWTLLVRGESVDVEYHHPTDTSPLTFAEYLPRAAALLAPMVEHFGHQASRVAVVQQGLLREVPPDVLQRVADRLLRLGEPFLESPPFDWNWRVCSRITRRFADRAESTNTVAVIKRVQGLISNAQPFDRLHISLDINTTPDERRARFSAADVIAFLSESVDWHRSLQQQVLLHAELEDVAQ